jgi:hypothetical protein
MQVGVIHGWLGRHKVHTSSIQQSPFLKGDYRKYLPLFIIALEEFYLSVFDLIIPASYAGTTGVITAPERPRVSYLDSLIFYAWKMLPQYFNPNNMVRNFKLLVDYSTLHKFRIWSINTVTCFDALACSERSLQFAPKKVCASAELFATDSFQNKLIIVIEITRKKKGEV